MGDAYTWPDVLSGLVKGQDLTADAARWAMDQVLSGDTTSVQIAGFAVALRAKGETVDEIVGFRDAILEAAVPLPVPAEVLDIVEEPPHGIDHPSDPLRR